MSLGLLGKKVGMTRVFDEETGASIPVTVIDVAGNEFLQTKTTETDGYGRRPGRIRRSEGIPPQPAVAWPLQQIRSIAQETCQRVPF